MSGQGCMYIIIDMADIVFSIEEYRWFLRKSFKVNESRLHEILNADIVFLLSGAKLFLYSLWESCHWKSHLKLRLHWYSLIVIIFLWMKRGEEFHFLSQIFTCCQNFKFVVLETAFFVKRQYVKVVTKQIVIQGSYTYKSSVDLVRLEKSKPWQ